MFARPCIRGPSVLPRSPLSHWRSTGSTGSSRRCLSRILWMTGRPPLPLAHPLDDGSAAVLAMPLQETCARLGTDGAAYRRAIAPLVRRWRDLVLMIQAPLLRMPAHPWLLARFGALAFWPAAPLARRLFRTEAARALFAGNAAHSVLPLD